MKTIFYQAINQIFGIAQETSGYALIYVDNELERFWYTGEFTAVIDIPVEKAEVIKKENEEIKAGSNVASALKGFVQRWDGKILQYVDAESVRVDTVFEYDSDQKQRKIRFYPAYNFERPTSSRVLWFCEPKDGIYRCFLYYVE